MVSAIVPTLSPAASLTLIGGELALDFANTSSARGSPAHQEHLVEAPNIVDWAAHAGVLPAEDADWLREAAKDDAELSHRLIDEALALHEDIYGLCSEIATGRPAPAERVVNLTRTHARCLAQAHLAPFQGYFVWSWRARNAPVEAVLGPISLSAMTTLLQADLTPQDTPHFENGGISRPFGYSGDRTEAPKDPARPWRDAFFAERGTDLSFQDSQSATYRSETPITSCILTLEKMRG